MHPPLKELFIFSPTSCFSPPNPLWGREKCLYLFMWLKSLETSLLLAAGSSSEASEAEQEAEGNSVSGPLDVWSVRLMDGQLVTGTSYRFLHRSK